MNESVDLVSRQSKIACIQLFCFFCFFNDGSALLYGNLDRGPLGYYKKVLEKL
jgi:hypothetical protein